jgi:aquaporin NIP
VSLVFGLIVMVMIYAGGHLSGARDGRLHTRAAFPARQAATYVVAQLAGGVTGALLLLAVWPDAPADLGATVPSIGVGAALLYEVVLTAFLMLVITAVATDTRAIGAAAAIAIGARSGSTRCSEGP